MNISALIAEFLDQTELRHRLVKTTRKAYGWHLRIYAAWMLASNMDTPTPDNIADWMDHIQRDQAAGGRGFQSRSTRVNWYALSKWDKWLVTNRHLPQSAMPEYELPALQEAEQAVHSDHDAELMGNAVETIEDPFRKALARAAYMVLTTATVRNSELRNLRVENYDPRAKSLQLVKTKTKNNRKLHLCNQCCEAIDFWLTLRPADTSHKFLFCWDRVRGLGDKGLKSLLREISQAAGFVGKVKSHLPHAMRHGSATRALKNGETIDQVRFRLGHSSIRTTQIYLHTDQESMQETRNVTALNLDTAIRDGDFKAFVAETQIQQEALANPKMPIPAQAPEPKPPKISDPRDWPKGKLRRLPPRK